MGRCLNSKCMEDWSRKSLTAKWVPDLLLLSGLPPFLLFIAPDTLAGVGVRGSRGAGAPLFPRPFLKEQLVSCIWQEIGFPTQVCEEPSPASGFFSASRSALQRLRQASSC